ncbi:MAG TPA: MFS transporter [Longimicrobium sp.]|nr:MFS transporter [Longimicrobium sp.]
MRGSEGGGRFTRREWLLLAVLTAVQFCHVLDFVLVMPLGPMLMRSLRIGPQQFGMLVSAYTFSAALAGLAAAAFMDRFDRKRMLLGLMAGFGIGTLLCGLTEQYAFLIAARIVAGAFGGVMAGVVFAIIGDQIRPERRGTATGVVMASFSAASVLGLPFGLSLAEHSGWQTPFLLLSAVTGLVLVFGLFALPAMRAHVAPVREAGPFRGLWEVAREPRHLMAFGFTTAIMFSAFTVTPYLSPYLTRNVGVPETHLDLVYLAGGLATLVTGPVIGRLADRYGHARVFAAAALLSIVPMLAVTNLPRVPLAVVLTVTSLMMVMGSGRMISATALLTGVVVPRHRGSFMSLNASVQQGAAGLATFVGGLVIADGADGRLTRYPWVGALAVGATLATLYLVTRLRTVAAAPALHYEAGAPPVAAPLEAPRHAAGAD